MALLDAVRSKLLADGVANTSTWKCWIGYAPDIADQCITLTASGGFAQDTLGNENLRQTFQATVRSTRLSWAACYAKWKDVFDSLQDADLSADNVRLVQALASGPLEWLDAENRVNMSVNFQAVVDAVTGSPA